MHDREVSGKPETGAIIAQPRHTRQTVAAGESLGDDARMFVTLSRLERFWLLPLAVLALFMTSCASQPGTAPTAGVEALPDLRPDGAWYRDGQLVLSYSHDDGKAYLSAAWPVDDLRPDRHNYRMAMLDLSTDAPADPGVIERDWQPGALYDSAHWDGLVEALLLQFAPSTPTSGVLVTVQGVDLVLYRDGHGGLHTLKIEDKPATLRVGQRISEEAFSARANDHLMAELARNGKAAAPALFAVGDDELGGAFVLFDFERRQSVFISRPPAPRPPGRQLGYTLQMIDALTLRSHVLSALRHPVTLANRLFWLGTHSLIVMLPHASYAGEDELPARAAARERERHRVSGKHGADRGEEHRHRQQFADQHRAHGAGTRGRRSGAFIGHLVLIAVEHRVAGEVQRAACDEREALQEQQGTEHPEQRLEQVHGRHAIGGRGALADAPRGRDEGGRGHCDDRQPREQEEERAQDVDPRAASLIQPAVQHVHVDVAAVQHRVAGPGHEHRGVLPDV